jgi:hypothetical protein
LLSWRRGMITEAPPRKHFDSTLDGHDQTWGPKRRLSILESCGVHTSRVVEPKRETVTPS